jgi:hypothetical protein
MTFPEKMGLGIALASRYSNCPDVMDETRKWGYFTLRSNPQIYSPQDYKQMHDYGWSACGSVWIYYPSSGDDN